MKWNQSLDQNICFSEMCKVVHISGSISAKDLSVKLNSFLAYKQPANFTCDDKKDSEICATAGEKVSLYCNKGNSTNILMKL